ncbi:amino acid permease/ SLC12A domain-containing protein [Aspergillus caelatus]|uniref:Amino acid permease/ SLC12A domain-containing protein n=1 Tax=Aspergillus caelatus TaxID=61420 RepID=A0A5N7AAI6_9EURO|nr:amino acid permease/ SLC12A domain-containing protein [Aspergillus caelatus]KAE8366725.1 amino acid permease/ SLC12A domain-containing protein [Aspergillus caelatus]
MIEAADPPHSTEDNAGKKDALDLGKVESCSAGQQFQYAERAGTKRNIKSRHAQMMAIGGAIGTGFFVGAGQALAIGGPGFLLLAYGLMSLLVYGVFTAVIEMSTYLPIPGSSIAYYCSRYVSSSLGFALGWLYFYSFGIIVAYEITAASLVINYWPNNVHIAVWVTVLLAVIVGLNLCPVGVYAEAEFWFAGIKVIMIIGMIILSLVIMLGGAPTHDRLGFRYWNDPGATNAYIVTGSGGRFTSFLYVWVWSGFSFFFGPELMVFTGGEMRNPRKNLPKASRRYFGRLVVFYILGTLSMGVTCPSNAEGLTSNTGDANASPWVIAIRNAGITALPSIINACILTSAWSAGNAYLYMSSRALYSLAVAGNAPKIFTRCNSYGLPIYAVLGSSCFTLLAYLNAGSQAGEVFNWFVSLTNTSGYTSWLTCCIIFLRFRKACDAQGIVMPYRSHIQPVAAWVCLFVFTVLLLCNGFTVFFPGRFSASGFLTAYLGIPLFLAIYFGHKLTVGRKDPWVYNPEDVDLRSGIDEVNAEAETWARMDAIKKEKKGTPNVFWRKISLIWS